MFGFGDADEVSRVGEDFRVVWNGGVRSCQRVLERRIWVESRSGRKRRERTRGRMGRYLVGVWLCECPDNMEWKPARQRYYSISHKFTYPKPSSPPSPLRTAYAPTPTAAPSLRTSVARSSRGGSPCCSTGTAFLLPPGSSSGAAP